MVWRCVESSLASSVDSASPRYRSGDHDQFFKHDRWRQTFERSTLWIPRPSPTSPYLPLLWSTAPDQLGGSFSIRTSPGTVLLSKENIRSFATTTGKTAPTTGLADSAPCETDGALTGEVVPLDRVSSAVPMSGPLSASDCGVSTNSQPTRAGGRIGLAGGDVLLGASLARLTDFEGSAAALNNVERPHADSGRLAGCYACRARERAPAGERAGVWPGTRTCTKKHACGPPEPIQRFSMEWVFL